MANELLYSGHAGLFNAAAVTPLAHALLADYTDLRSLCEYKGSINGTGSTVIEVPKYSLAQAMADTSEGADAANQDGSTTSVNITVARKSIVREPSHLFQMAGGALDVVKLAESVMKSASLKFTDMLCALFSSVTAVKGTSGAVLTYDAFLEAQNALRLAGVPSEYGVFAVLHPKQINELVDSYRAETGVEVFRPQANEILMQKGFGYQFNMNGVDVFSCDSVASDGTDYIGCMFGYSAFAYGDGLPDSMRLQNALMAATAPDNAAVWVVVEDNHRKGTTEIIGNYYVGVSLIEDARAVRIRSVD